MKKRQAVVVRPLTLGELADALYLQREKRLEKEREVEQMRSEETRIREKILAQLNKQKLEKASGKVCTVSKSPRAIATIEDWDMFYKFIVANDACDLLERRPSASALKDRIEAGQNVKGAKLEFLDYLSVAKAGKR